MVGTKQMKRYDLEYVALGCEGYNALLEAQEGGWVKFEDADQLRTELKYLTSLLNIQEGIIDRLKKEIGDYKEKYSDINKSLNERISW